MTTETTLTVTSLETALSHEQIDILRGMGSAANRAAANSTFTRFQAVKSDQTSRRHRADLAKLAEYLNQAADMGGEALNLEPDTLYTKPDAWAAITHGLLEGFKGWQTQQGYSIASINARLSTARRYAGLAMQAGALDADEYARIKLVSGYSRKNGLEADKKRDVTRRGAKKPDFHVLTPSQRRALKSLPDMRTPTGRRDKVLICLLLDHGLRCGELAILQVTDIDLKAGSMTFTRPKVAKKTTHTLTAATLRALRAYADAGDMPAAGALLRSSAKGGTLTHGGMSARAITARIRYLGQQIGIDNLSAHDLRHSWATKYSNERRGDTFGLQEAGGWNSLAMPRRYVEMAEIAFDGGLSDDEPGEPQRDEMHDDERSEQRSYE